MKMDNLLRFLHQWYNDMTFLSQDGFAYKRTCAGVPSGLMLTQYIDSFVNLFVIIDAMLEFGFSELEILDFKFLILGDDNTGMTNINIDKIQQFVSFYEEYLLSRWNMKISEAKSVITTLRSKIVTLSYECNFGHPKKDINKLIAQLCYPERKFKPQYQSYRAIGFAYAACGHDDKFHNFCEDIYYTYKYCMAPLSNDIAKYLPGQFTYLEDNFNLKLFATFPTISEVRDQTSKFAGSLSFSPKWKDCHFKNDPDHYYSDALTILNMRKN